MHIILAAPRGLLCRREHGHRKPRAGRSTCTARRSTSITKSSITTGWWSASRSWGRCSWTTWPRCPRRPICCYSAHGVSPEVRRQAHERRLQTIDATCPLVTKVHREAVQFAARGYTIVLIGHAGHDEVVGTMGESPGAFRLVESRGRRGPAGGPRSRPAGLPDADHDLGARGGADHRPAARSGSQPSSGRQQEDICYATQNRQEAVRALAGQADMVLVVGSAQQLQQPAAGRVGTVRRRAGAPDRRAGRHRPGLVRRRRDGVDHGRGQRPGKRGPGVRGLAPRTVRRGDPRADGLPGAGGFPGAQAAPRGVRGCAPFRLSLRHVKNVCASRTWKIGHKIGNH